MSKNYLSLQAREHNKALAKKEEDMKNDVEKKDGAGSDQNAATFQMGGAVAMAEGHEADDAKKDGAVLGDVAGTAEVLKTVLLPIDKPGVVDTDKVKLRLSEVGVYVEAHGMARVLGLRRGIVIEAAVAAGGIRDKKGRLYVPWNKLGAWGGMMGRSDRIMLEDAKKVRAPAMKDGMEYVVVTHKPGMNRMVRAESVAAGTKREMMVKVRDPRLVCKGDELLVKHGALGTEAINDL